MSTLFVTVGSTRFDKLINKFLSDRFLKKIKHAGFKNIIIQAGNSDIPNYKHGGLDIIIYDYKATIIDDARKADLVICHAGAGTCLEMLRLNKKVLVVVNDSLMDNHQSELAEQLAKDGYVIMSTTDDLEDNFSTSQGSDLVLKKFPKQNNRFSEILDATLQDVIYKSV